MHLEIRDSRFLVMNREFQNAPGSLGSCDVVTVSVFGNLISLVIFTGHPGVNLRQPVPVPAKTRTRRCGCGFFVGTGVGFHTGM